MIKDPRSSLHFGPLVKTGVHYDFCPSLNHNRTRQDKTPKILRISNSAFIVFVLSPPPPHIRGEYSETNK